MCRHCRPLFNLDMPPNHLRATRRSIGQQFIRRLQVSRNFNLERMIKKAALKPLSTIKQCRAEMEALEKGYHARLYDIVAAAYAVAWHFKKSPTDWNRFLKLP